MDEPVKFEKMFEPFKIENVEIRNRIVMAPLNTSLVSSTQVSEQLIAYLAARARNGVGMIVTSPVAGVVIPGMPQPPLLNSPDQLAGWNELAETIHAFRAKLVIQLMPGVGRQAHRGLATKAPSPIPLHIPPENLPQKCLEFEKRRNLSSIWEHLMVGPVPQELTTDEILAAENSYVVSARLVKAFGADGVELHFSHGYMAYSLLSPRTNLRKDMYGGSYDNRLRFLVNVLTKVRQEVGESYLVGMRISGAEHMPGGLEVEDTGRILKTAEGLGLDYVHLSDGCFEAARWYVPDEDGTMLGAAAYLKKLLQIPILTPGLHNPVLAERSLREGMTDMVSLGRAILADAEWVKKVQEGQYQKIVKCIRCLTCLRRTRNGLYIRCEVNPGLGNERYDPANYRLNAPHKKPLFYPGQN